MNSQKSAGVAPQAPGAGSSDWTVVCLCAAWCGVCRQYAQDFGALQSKFSDVRFVWMDVEEQEQLVGDVDVETFPTLLIGCGAQVKFLGPLLPQTAVLEKLLQTFLQGAPAAASLPAEAQGLWLRIASQWQGAQREIHRP